MRVRLVTDPDGSTRLVYLFHKSVLRSVEDEYDASQILTDAGDYAIVPKLRAERDRQLKQLGIDKLDSDRSKKMEAQRIRPQDRLRKAYLLREKRPSGLGNGRYNRPSTLTRTPSVPDPRNPFAKVPNHVLAERQRLAVQEATRNSKPKQPPEPPAPSTCQVLDLLQSLLEFKDLVQDAWASAFNFQTLAIVVIFLYWAFKTFYREP